MDEFPKIFRVRQSFEAPQVDDPAAAVRAELARMDWGARLRPGARVAITAGSRGIANIVPILRAIVAHLKALGAAPLVAPSMGSHGGATAAGQTRVLADYGIVEQAIGCPIVAGMETVVVGQAAEGFPLHFDRIAHACDHVLVVGRVKPHTLFAGAIESGLMKMLLIGLGNQAGADTYHRAVEAYGFARVVRSAAPLVIERCRILGGVAIVENARDQTALIEAVPAEAIVEREPQLLQLARRWMARLPFDEADVLLVDRIGKNISGSGLDPNIVGRKFDEHKAVEGETPRVKRICLRGLTDETHGNAFGLGVAEFCHRRLIQQMDAAVTRINVLTSGHIASGMTPLICESDQSMLATALRTVGLGPPGGARLMWIANTLHLDVVACSAAYLDEARQRRDLEVLEAPRPLPFDAAGDLPDALTALADAR